MAVLVILDANVLVASPFQTTSYWTALRDAVKAGTVHVYVPDLAIEEAAATFARRAEPNIADLRSRSKKAPKEAAELMRRAAEVWQLTCDSYEVGLRERVSFATVLPAPDVHHDELARRAIRRVPPFDSHGGGYRDSLHWFSALELLESTSPGESSPGSDAVFVSGDKRAFGPEQHERLHAEVEARSDWRLHFVADLTQVQIPGLFTDETASVEDLQDVSVFASGLHDEVRGTSLSSDLFGAVTYDAILVEEVSHMELTEESAQVFYVSQELLIEFEVVLTCILQFESLQAGSRDETNSLSVTQSIWELTIDGGCESHSDRSIVSGFDWSLKDVRFVSHL